MGIEPTRPAWKAGILPLNYTRMYLIFSVFGEFFYPCVNRLYIIPQLEHFVNSFFEIFLIFFIFLSVLNFSQKYNQNPILHPNVIVYYAQDASKKAPVPQVRHGSFSQIIQYQRSR